jgi:hypothetical protein
MNTLTPPTPSKEEIAVGAYHLYLIEGCHHGRDWEHWFRAEQQLRAKASALPTATAPAATAPPAKKAAKKVTAKKAPVKKAAAKK